jgi:rRNA maturation RNase YbeY
MQKPINIKHNIEIRLQTRTWVEKLNNYKALIYKSINMSLNCIDRNMTLAEISVVLADNNFIRQLNREYRFQDKPTNVLSFSALRSNQHAPGQPHFLGDIILAFETVLEEAIQQHKTFKDHTVHLIVHGILHLLGYDHKTDEEAEEMEIREIEILAQLDINNPYNDRIESVK